MPRKVKTYGSQRSRTMRALEEQIDFVARSNLPVLITGETGVGKERVARAVHRRSSRALRPWVAENCTALSQSLLEAELFGHTKGSFTGAEADREGLFERADGGSLFLDEVGDMSLDMQAKLLRVLEDGELRRVGGDRARRVNVRLIAATHRDLEELELHGRFRSDLRYRIAVLRLHVPPLRERLDELESIAEQLLREHARAQRAMPKRLTPRALNKLFVHDWPGNVRELRNVLRAAAVVAPGVEIPEAAIQLDPPRPPVAPLPGGMPSSYQELREQLEARERSFVRLALRRAEGNKSEAARLVGVTRYAFMRALRRLGVGSHAGSSSRRCAS